MPVQLSSLNANQVSNKWVEFLKDCAAFGDDVSYITKVFTGGALDPVTDKIVGGAEVSNEVFYPRSALAAPVRYDERLDKSGMGNAIVLGHQLGGVVTGETYIARVKVNLPLSATAVYQINGMNYRFTKLVDTFRIGRKAMWNLAMFTRA